MDVAAWLKNLGLGQYEAAFRDNAIDGDLLETAIDAALGEAAALGITGKAVTPFLLGKLRAATQNRSLVANRATGARVSETAWNAPPGV